MKWNGNALQNVDTGISESCGSCDKCSVDDDIIPAEVATLSITSGAGRDCSDASRQNARRGAGGGDSDDCDRSFSLNGHDMIN